MHVDKFYKDSFILTLSNMVTGIIAFVFSLILSRELGAEGLGLYGLVMPIYGLLLCITSDGIITAISKITAVYFGRKDIKNLNKTIGTIFGFVILWAAGTAFLVLICNKGIAAHIVRDARAAKAIMMLSPALLFVPVSAVVKGFFYGQGIYKVTSTVDIGEKLLRVVILLSAISLLHPESVDETVAAAYFALAAGELLSMSLLLICYKVRKRRISGILNAGCRVKSRIQLAFDVFVISIPLSLNGVCSSILSTASTLVLPRRLVAAGFSHSDALSLIGRFNGMALNISGLPYIIIGSMLTVLVPELSLNISRKDYWSAEERIAQVLKISCAIGISTSVVCLVLPDVLGQLFYRRNDLADMIRFSVPINLISFVASPTFGMLNALGKQNILLKNSIIVSLEELSLIFVLAGIPALNIYGYGLAAILTSFTALVINIREIKKICEFKIELQDVITLILTGIVAYLASGIAVGLMGGAAPALLAAAVVVVSFGSVLGLNSLAIKLKA